MGVVSYNSVGGYSTGLTMTAVIDATGNITGVSGSFTGNFSGATGSFSRLLTASAGISAAGGVTLAGTFSGTTATFTGLSTFNAGLSGHINISSSNATGNMYLLMARGAGVTAVFADTTTTPLVYQASLGNLGLKGISLADGSDRLYITPTQVTATNTVTPSSAYFYFIAEGGNYLQSPVISQIGDIGAVNSALTLSVDPSTRTMTWSDGVLGTGVTSGFFGVNRNPSGMCADYAVEINSPTGKGLQLIYNDYDGAASNWVNMDVSSGGNYTVRPSGGLATVTGTLNVSAGISAAGGVTLAGTLKGVTASFTGLLSASSGISCSGVVIFKDSVYTEGSLYTDNIFDNNGQLSLNDKANSRVAIGDSSANANSTSIYLRDDISILDISNPFGNIQIGDPGGVDSGYAIAYNAPSGYLDGGGSSLTNWSSGSFSGLLTASAGISAAGGVTFAGTVASDTGYRITSNAINAQTGTTYTFLESDNGKVVTFNNGSAVTVTIPTALPVGFNCTAIQLGAGQVGFTAASGVTMQSYGSQYRLIGQHASASVIEYTTNIVNLSGNLVT